MGGILILWSIELLKDGISQFYPWFTDPYIRNLYMLFDLIAVPLCSIYIWTIIYSDWLSSKKFWGHIAPFAAFFILYFITKNEIVYFMAYIMLIIYVILNLVLLHRAVDKYKLFIAENYSYRKNIDIDWLNIVILLFVINMILCVVVYNNPTSTNFYFYYAYCLVMWAFIIHKSDTQKILTIPFEKNIDEKEESIEIMFSLSQRWEEQLQDLFEKDKMFLQQSLTLKDVATKIGTNRSYLSEYINNKKNSTFFDYVNNYRLEYAVKLLSDKNKKITKIYLESGFNSFATFARVFKNKYGCTPKYYRNKFLQ